MRIRFVEPAIKRGHNRFRARDSSREASPVFASRKNFPTVHKTPVSIVTAVHIEVEQTELLLRVNGTGEIRRGLCSCETLAQTGFSLLKPPAKVAIFSEEKSTLRETRKIAAMSHAVEGFRGQRIKTIPVAGDEFQHAVGQRFLPWHATD